MKTTSLYCAPAAASARGVRAMTLTEMLVTVAIFSVAIMGILQLHLFGLRQNELVESKLGASDQARMSFGRMLQEIRSAKVWDIGDGSVNSFTAVPNGTAQQGTALEIYTTTDTNNYIRYYFDTNAKELRRSQYGLDGYSVVADHLTNSMFFRAEDHQGNIKTDLSYKYVIRIVLQFYQYQFPQTQIGPGYLYDYYKLEFKVASHCPDGA